MSSADLISLGSLIVAIAAFGVSYFTYKVNKRTQVSTEEQNLNDLRQNLNGLIDKMQSSLASLARPKTTFKLESFAEENSALAGLQVQAQEAKALAEQGLKQGLTLDWLQNTVLAYAFTQTWDPAGAEVFWKAAVEGAKTPQARIRSLTSRAEFYYIRGLNDDRHHDWQDARADYEAALKELHRDPDRQGPDLVAEQAALMELYQAGLEYNVGNDSMAVGLVADAFVDANKVSAPWRKLSALDRLGNLVQVMGNQVIPPRPVLPDVAAELSRRGVTLDKFPPETAALLSMPPDGSQQVFGQNL